MRQDAPGFPLVMLLLQTAQQLLALGIVTQAESGSFSKGPLEVRIADFLPEVPTRLPPDALRHVTRRPSEAQACPLGTRSL